MCRYRTNSVQLSDDEHNSIKIMVYLIENPFRPYTQPALTQRQRDPADLVLIQLLMDIQDVVSCQAYCSVPPLLQAHQQCTLSTHNGHQQAPFLSAQTESVGYSLIQIHTLLDLVPYSIQKLVLYKKQYLHNKAKATFWLCLLVELDKEHVSFYSYI